MIQTENFPFSFPRDFVSASPEETFALGEKLAPLLGKGSVVALRGPLGAGKTCLTKGIAKGLGIEDEVTSPTYTIVSEYESSAVPGDSAAGPLRFFHIDAYRLRGDDDFSAIGGEEIIFGKGISVIEWSEQIPASIPAEALRIDIEIREDGARFIRVYTGDDSGNQSRGDAKNAAGPVPENSPANREQRNSK